MNRPGATATSNYGWDSLPDRRIMTRQFRDALDSFLYEVLQASSMVLFLVSSIAASRRKQFVQLGVTHPLELTGLPNLCISPCITNVHDDDLYGHDGVAAQMAYKGWVVALYDQIWETRHRNALKDSLGEKAIRPEMDALGDLRHIRNDLLHNDGTARARHCGQCSTLKWFKAGERMIFGTRHVLDFLNQIGILSPNTVFTDGMGSCTFRVFRDRRELLAWSPTPSLVSIRTHSVGKEADPPCKPVTVVFDNGLFANVAIELEDQRRWGALGNARITGDGRLLCFEDGTIIDSNMLYRSAADAREPRGPDDGRPRLPFTGSVLRIAH